MTIVDRPLPSSFISGYIGGIILVVVWFTALNYLARRQAD